MCNLLIIPLDMLSPAQVGRRASVGLFRHFVIFNLWLSCRLAGRQTLPLAHGLALALPLALGAFPKVDYKLKALVIAALSQQLAGGRRQETGGRRQVCY